MSLDLSLVAMLWLLIAMWFDAVALTLLRTPRVAAPFVFDVLSIMVSLLCLIEKSVLLSVWILVLFELQDPMMPLNLTQVTGLSLLMRAFVISTFALLSVVGSVSARYGADSGCDCTGAVDAASAEYAEAVAECTDEWYVCGNADSEDSSRCEFSESYDE